MKPFHFILLIVFISAQGALQAQYAFREGGIEPILGAKEQPLTLEECLAYAIGQNPDLKSVKLGEQINQYQIKEVKASALPQVNASGQYSNNFALAEQLLPGEFFGAPGTTIPVKFGVANMLNGNIEVRQLLFNKSYSTGLKAAKTTQSLAELQTFKTTEDLVYNVAQIYLQIQITEKQKEVLKANLERISQLIGIAQIQFEEGIIKRVDVDQLKVNKTNLSTEVQNLDLSIAQQKNLLKFYMGMPPEEDVQIADYISEGNQYPLVDNLILSENTNLRLLDKQLELSQLEMENIKAGYFPTLSAFVQYGWQGQTDKLFSNDEQYDIQGSTIGVLGLSLNVPIFDGFQKKNQLQQSKIKQNQIVLDRMNLNNLTRMEFANANENLTQNKVLLATQKENMTLAEALYEVTKLSYQEGVAPLTELLNAETSLKEAQTQYLASLLRLNLAELDHMKTSGQLAQLIRNSNN